MADVSTYHEVYSHQDQF